MFCKELWSSRAGQAAALRVYEGGSHEGCVSITFGTACEVDDELPGAALKPAGGVLGHPDNLSAAIGRCIMAGPVVCQHALDLRFYAVLQAEAQHIGQSTHRGLRRLGLCCVKAEMWCKAKCWHKQWLPADWDHSQMLALSQDWIRMRTLQGY